MSGHQNKTCALFFYNIQWDDREQGRWIEPFVGSGVVAFNLAPERALLADTNKHIIALYQAIQRGEMSTQRVRAFLENAGKQLEKHGAPFYYDVRERFNVQGDPFDFLFFIVPVSADVATHLECGFALSMWQENRYRTNDHLETCWNALEKRTYSHFYHVGSQEGYRNAIQEALVIKPGFSVLTQNIADINNCE